MKILIYFPGNINEPKGTPIRVKNIVSQLVKNKAEVYYVGPIKPEGVEDLHFAEAKRPLVRPFVLSRLVNTESIDIVFLQTSASLWLAPFVKILTRAKVGLEFHSLLVEEEKVYKNLNNFQYAWRKYFELFLCMFLDFATGVSKPLGDYYKSVVNEYLVLPGGVDLSVFHEHIVPAKDLMSWKQGSILVGYAGNTKWYQGLDTCLEALVLLKKRGYENYKLAIIASSVEDEVTRYITDAGLEQNVKILGKRPHNEIPSLLSAADILTIVRPSDKVTEYAFPSKFPEHAALGKALIISLVGDAGHYVKDGASGIVVKPSNPEEVAEAILRLSNDELRRRVSEGAAALAKEVFDINVLGNKLYNFLLSQCK